MNHIKSLIGNTLCKIVAGIYFENKNKQNFPLDDIMDICLIFKNLSITLSTSHDGESLDIRLGNQLKEIDMDEYGFIGIQDISEILGHHREIVIKDINILTNEQNIECGLELISGEKKLIIQNIGDQLFVSNI